MFIYLLQLGFLPVAVVGRLYRNRTETALREKQYKTRNTQNRKQKCKTEQKTNIKGITSMLLLQKAIMLHLLPETRVHFPL